MKKQRSVISPERMNIFLSFTNNVLYLSEDEELESVPNG